MAASALPSNERFPKSRRLRKRRDFLKLSQRGKRFSGELLLIEIATRDPARPSRLGITAARQYGKAHDRNRFKRLVREAFRLSPIPQGIDIVVKPRPSAKGAKMAHIQADLHHLLARFI